jgi:hypothetical protein
MALHEDIGREAKKLVLPAAASLAGAGAGLALTRKSVRDAMPDLGDRGIGDLTDDLRKKLDSVIGKRESSSTRARGSSSSSSGQRRLDSSELRQRRDEREQRRSKRRARS